eukprot:392810-Prorocentrum_lima.AAC.1
MWAHCAVGSFGPGRESARHGKERGREATVNLSPTDTLRPVSKPTESSWGRLGCWQCAGRGAE